MIYIISCTHVNGNSREFNCQLAVPTESRRRLWEERLLRKNPQETWRAHQRGVPISHELTFTPHGLVLGAGTVLVEAQVGRLLKSVKGQEARVLALLSAAYGRAVVPSVLGNIERATKAWREGDDCLAYMHLAHARLQSVEDLRGAAYRLFLADSAMAHGESPRAVLEALAINVNYIQAVEKLYNPEEPRVPAGSGPTSGQWTRLLSWMGELDAAQVAELGAYAARVLGPASAAAAAFGILFIPSPENIRVEGEVPELPGLRYSWNRDEAELHLAYDDGAGDQRTFSAFLDGDVFRDQQGNVIGRVIDGNRVAIDAIAALPDLVNQDEPRLCPAPAPDVLGSDQGKSYEENLARQYEDFLKQFINPPPDGPTPSGFVYYLPNPAGNGQPVSYDDCQKATGFLFEFKGEQYAWLLTVESIVGSITDKFLAQSASQIAASGGRPVVWIFAEQEAALFASRLFNRRTRGANLSSLATYLGRGEGQNERPVL
jgi:hypothetical protein